jgi:TPR repeat protein
VKLGDYYYYGLGTQVSYEAAATQYRMASDKQGTPQAMFNLGYMYEHGEGLEKVRRNIAIVKLCCHKMITSCLYGTNNRHLQLER